MEPALQQRGHEVENNTEPTNAKSDPEPVADDQRETPKMLAHDSMVTVRLSEPPVLTLDTNFGPDSPPRRRPSTVRIEKPPFSTDETEAKAKDLRDDNTEDTSPSGPTTPLPATTAAKSLQDELVDCEEDDEVDEGQLNPVGSEGDLKEPVGQGIPVEDEEEEEDEEEVNWDELQKTEAEEPRDADTDRVSAQCIWFIDEVGKADSHNSPPRCCWLCSRKRTTSWRRIQRPSKYKLLNKSSPPTGPDRHRWRNYDTWSMGQPRRLYDTRCSRRRR